MFIFIQDTIEDADMYSGIVNNTLFTLCGIDDIIYIEVILLIVYFIKFKAII